MILTYYNFNLFANLAAAVCDETKFGSCFLELGSNKVIPLVESESPPGEVNNNVQEDVAQTTDPAEECPNQHVDKQIVNKDNADEPQGEFADSAIQQDDLEKDPNVKSIFKSFVDRAKAVIGPVLITAVSTVVESISFVHSITLLSMVAWAFSRQTVVFIIFVCAAIAQFAVVVAETRRRGLSEQSQADVDSDGTPEQAGNTSENSINTALDDAVSQTTSTEAVLAESFVVKEQEDTIIQNDSTADNQDDNNTKTETNQNIEQNDAAITIADDQINTITTEMIPPEIPQEPTQTEDDTAITSSPPEPADAESLSVDTNDPSDGVLNQNTSSTDGTSAKSTSVTEKEDVADPLNHSTEMQQDRSSHSKDDGDDHINQNDDDDVAAAASSTTTSSIVATTEPELNLSQRRTISSGIFAGPLNMTDTTDIHFLGLYVIVFVTGCLAVFAAAAFVAQGMMDKNVTIANAYNDPVEVAPQYINPVGEYYCFEILITPEIYGTQVPFFGTKHRRKLFSRCQSSYPFMAYFAFFSIICLKLCYDAGRLVMPKSSSIVPQKQNNDEQKDADNNATKGVVVAQIRSMFLQLKEIFSSSLLGRVVTWCLGVRKAFKMGIRIEGKSNIFWMYVFFNVFLDIYIQYQQAWVGEKAYAVSSAGPTAAQTMVSVFQIVSVTEAFCRNSPTTAIMFNILSDFFYVLVRVYAAGSLLALRQDDLYGFVTLVYPLFSCYNQCRQVIKFLTKQRKLKTQRNANSELVMKLVDRRPSIFLDKMPRMLLRTFLSGPALVIGSWVAGSVAIAATTDCNKVFDENIFPSSLKCIATTFNYYNNPPCNCIVVISRWDRAYSDPECGGFGRPANGLAEFEFSGFERMMPFLEYVQLFSAVVANTCDVYIQAISQPAPGYGGNNVEEYSNTPEAKQFYKRISQLENLKYFAVQFHDSLHNSHPVLLFPQDFAGFQNLQYFSIRNGDVYISEDVAQNWKSLTVFDVTATFPRTPSHYGCKVVVWGVLQDCAMQWIPEFPWYAIAIYASGTNACRPTTMKNCDEQSGRCTDCTQWSRSVLSRDPGFGFQTERITIKQHADMQYCMDTNDVSSIDCGICGGGRESIDCWKEPATVVCIPEYHAYIYCEYPVTPCPHLDPTVADLLAFGRGYDFSQNRRSISEAIAANQKRTKEPRSACGTDRGDWPCEALRGEYYTDFDINRNGLVDGTELPTQHPYAVEEVWECLRLQYGIHNYTMLDWFDARTKGEHTCNQCEWWEDELSAQQANAIIDRNAPVAECEEIMRDDLWRVHLQNFKEQCISVTETVCSAPCYTIYAEAESFTGDYVDENWLRYLFFYVLGFSDSSSFPSFECLAALTSCEFKRFQEDGPLVFKTTDFSKLIYALWPELFPDDVRTECSDCDFFGFVPFDPECPVPACNQELDRLAICSTSYDTCPNDEVIIDPWAPDSSRTTCNHAIAQALEFDIDGDRRISEEEWKATWSRYTDLDIEHCPLKCFEKTHNGPHTGCFDDLSPQEKETNPSISYTTFIKTLHWYASDAHWFPASVFPQTDCASCPSMQFLESYPDCPASCLKLDGLCSVASSPTTCTSSCSDILSILRSVDENGDDVFSEQEFSSYWQLNSDGTEFCPFECMKVHPGISECLDDSEDGMSVQMATRLAVSLTSEHQYDPEQYPITSCEDCTD